MNVCQHLQPHQYPLVIDRVLDDHLGFTDALAHCHECGCTILLEMIDWRGSLRLFRMSVVDQIFAEELLRDLDRGSCDLARAGAQIAQFQQMHAKVTHLLLIDMSLPEIIGIRPVGVERLPRSSWRELPCDGRRIADFPHPS